MKRINVFKRSVWTLLSVFFAFLFVILLVAGTIAKQNSSWIDDTFGVRRYILVDDENAAEQDTQYFKSDFAKKDENGKLILETDKNGAKKQVIDNVAMRKNSLDVVERVNEEGSVLLWNNGKALPLADKNKVSLFGAAMYNWFYHGGGSGRVPYAAGENDLAASLKSRGISVNENLYNTLKALRKSEGYGAGLEDASGSSEVYRSRGNGCFFSVNEMPWSRVSSDLPDIATYGDAAIYTISRYGAENSDVSFISKESDDGSYLSLTREEKGVIAGLKSLKSQGLKKVILVINTSVPIMLRDVDTDAVDACLWVGFGGSASTDAVADLLVGKTNPSGHLTDTWVYDQAAVPANENYYGITYAGDTSGIPESFGAGGTFEANDKYLVYQEGIYVGYRYFETRYEDYVLKRGNAASNAGAKMSGGEWKYASEVAYSFGYGGSYTTFEHSGFSVKKSDDDYVVSMTIKNTGDIAGKDVMQVYLQKPYTEYDKTNKVEKASVELVGFEKTKLLAPGESETLSVTVSEYDFKSYDSYGKGTYILEKGDYYLAAGHDAHDAINNILAEKGKTVSDGMTANGNKSFVYKTAYSHDDFETYAVSPKGVKVQNRFDDTDINRYDGRGNNSVTYLSRSDWSGTYPSSPTLTITEKMTADLQYERAIANDPADEMPVYGKDTYEGGHLSLIQLKDVPYGDGLWEHILNQMSFTEQSDIVANGAHCIAGCQYIAAPGFNAPDGPQGIVDKAYILPDLGTLMAFTGGPIVASTFNRDVVEEMGKAFGEELNAAGCVGTYGVGTNTHRSAYGGRNWEYYSEDSFLAAQMNAAESKGLREKGCVTFTKHFALNDMESFRDGLQVWANEQSVREIYLKAFETAVIEGYTNGIMSAFHRLGTTWTGVHTGLITDLLRGEWGFNGILETDSPRGYHMGKGHWSIGVSSIMAGQDVWMGNFTGGLSTNVYKAQNGTAALAIRESMHRVLYVMLHSSAMNGMSSTTRVQYVVPAWEKLVLALQIVSGILMGACLVMTAVCWIKYSRENKQNQK